VCTWAWCMQCGEYCRLAQLQSKMRQCCYVWLVFWQVLSYNMRLKSDLECTWWLRKNGSNVEEGRGGSSVLSSSHTLIRVCSTFRALFNTVESTAVVVSGLKCSQDQSHLQHNWMHASSHQCHLKCSQWPQSRHKKKWSERRWVHISGLKLSSQSKCLPSALLCQDLGKMGLVSVQLNCLHISTVFTKHNASVLRENKTGSGKAPD
jgi:hypothetical protein